LIATIFPIVRQNAYLADASVVGAAQNAADDDIRGRSPTKPANLLDRVRGKG
jgi:hypothetical protein